MSEYTHKTEDLKYIKSIDLNIASKVTRTQRNEKPEKIDLFDEYQIKWFNQQSEEDLIELNRSKRQEVKVHPKFPRKYDKLDIDYTTYL